MQALDQINDVLRSALAYQRLRVEVASHNLALGNVAIKPGAASPLLNVVPGSSFAGQLGLATTAPVAAGSVEAGYVEAGSTEARKAQTRTVLDPQHPYADSEGFVHYPRLDTVREMATLVSATRAYEADIRAYNSLRAMTMKAFEIGK